MKDNTEQLTERIIEAFGRARRTKPAYEELYPFLEALFLSQARLRKSVQIRPPEVSSELVQAKWAEGFPVLRRWEFPVDVHSAANVLAAVKGSIPASNASLSAAHAALAQALERHPTDEHAFWESFLHHEWEPWEQWVDTEGLDAGSLLFLARSCLRPSVEVAAEVILQRFPLTDSWQRGYCPVCGSLPALLLLEGEGLRRGHCSWCGTRWRMYRLQCPYCDNRLHESLGYLQVETEPLYRVQYCHLCKSYFKLVDTRELLEQPYLPLEEWTTLHLDILAQQAGWHQPPSPSPTVYPDLRPSL